jgi:[NiFe] hydrogenase diaphorase moiety small subunit
MSQIIKFKIDGIECMAQKGEYIVEAARKNGIFIPTLCNITGVKPRGACRICNVKVNGKLMTACTTPVMEGMTIENKTVEIEDLRRAILELMFIEGNHFCPACEKSGNCDLQALAYRYKMMVPRFQFQFNQREIEASHPKLIKDHNRCILCKRCIRAIKDEKGRSLFAFSKRGYKLGIKIDTKLSKDMSDDMAQKAADICPVGALLLKEEGFKTPIGKRKYDLNPIGSDVEKITP